MGLWTAQLYRLSALVLALLDCGRKPADRETPAAASASVQSALPAESAPTGASAARDVYPFRSLARCRVDHGGAFLDLGSETSQFHRSFSLGPFTDVSGEGWGDQGSARFSAADAGATAAATP